MERQPVIDSLEAIARDLESMSGFILLIGDFTNKAVSKKQVREFCEEYVLDTFMAAGDLKPLYAKLSIEASTNNGWALKQAIADGHTVKATEMVTNLRNRLCKALDGVFSVVASTNTELADKGFPDLAERVMALRRAVCKIKSIFITSRQLPINIDQFPELEVIGDDDNDYLTKDLGQIITLVKESFKFQFENMDNWTLLTMSEESVIFTSSLLDKNNWISLRNFVLYLDTFNEY